MTESSSSQIVSQNADKNVASESAPSRRTSNRVALQNLKHVDVKRSIRIDTQERSAKRMKTKEKVKEEIYEDKVVLSIRLSCF